nr:hypothetical protein [Tanacetum cinerariifolium]
MSDSEDSRITYMDICSLFEHLLDIGSPGVDGLPMVPQDPYVQAALQAPPSPDCVSGPEHPPSPVYVSDFVLEPVYPKFMPVEDDILPAEDQPLPDVASLTTESPCYINESNLDEDPKDDPVNYPADRGDEGDDKDESFDDNEDDDIDIEGDEEEGEHLAPADSTVVALPAVDHAPSA